MLFVLDRGLDRGAWPQMRLASVCVRRVLICGLAPVPTSTLQMMGGYQYVDTKLLRAFLMETQNREVGGFGKTRDDMPDILHSYFGIAGLALLGEPGVLPIVPKLNVSARAAHHLYNGTVGYRPA